MLKRLLYITWIILLLICIFACAKNSNLLNFIDVVEDRTFDLRQSVMANDPNRRPSDDIVIIAIDDASYEYILNHYGEWPMPRNLYVDLINYVEKQKPQSIAFDLMFVESIKSSVNADALLIDSIINNDNVFVAMNFDNQPFSLREPPSMPRKLAKSVINESSKVDLSRQTFTNCRAILSGIVNGTENIGITNVLRSDDGILRRVPAFLRYQGGYYPQLAVAVGLKYLKDKQGISEENFRIDKNSNLILGDRKIFLDKDGGLILNWYGAQKSYKYIPLYTVLKAAKEGVTSSDLNFKNKIVYVGTTAVSLFDIKTVPVSRAFPGVEVQATCVNNIIDNNFIYKVDTIFTVLICILLSLITVLIVLYEASALVGALASMSIYLLYILITYYSMKYFNIWLNIVYPLLFSIITFTIAYIIKYIIKSRDFERQYLLATTDGLTELYNHRYFEEQLKLVLESSKREGSQFSLIILDIDFFKKFNDTYGHQAGDAVLRQVAQTLKKNVRASDIVFRYGGEEMSIILNHTEYDAAVTVAEKLCNKISSRDFRLPNGKDVKVTISLGASTFPADGINPEEVVESADKRLYNAKENGRNRVGSKDV